METAFASGYTQVRTTVFILKRRAVGRRDLLGALEGRARFAAPEHETSVRVAGHSGNVYFDLCNAEWEVVEVTPEGWRIIPGGAAPVRFRRASSPRNSPARWTIR